VFTGFPPDAFPFFAQLAKNNHRDWFQAHKDVYERACREPMKALMAAVDPPFGTGWLSRINNDMRFNKDRAPYKTHIDASVKGYYVSVGAQGMYVGTGLYKPESAALRQLREAIAADASGKKLRTIVMALRRKGLPYIFVSAFPDLAGPYRDATLLEKPCTASDLINAATVLVAQAGQFDGLDPHTWDSQTLDLLQQAVKEALELHRQQLDSGSDGGKVARRIAAKAVTDLALTGVRDLRRLANFALLALQGSLEKEMRPAPNPCDC